MTGVRVLDAALDYRQRGWSAIPLAERAKNPTARWERFQSKLPGTHDLHYWFERDLGRNIGIVTGGVSGLLVLDVDGDEGAASVASRPIPPTPAVRTGRGRHYYFAHPGGVVANAVSLLPGVDVRGDGGYVVAPPSVHASGAQYEWIECLSPADTDLAPCPDWLVALIDPARAGRPRPRATPDEWSKLLAHGAAEGERNSATARLAGLLLRQLDPYVAMEAVAAWNDARNRPPLSRVEVETTVRSVASTALRRRGGARRGR